MEEESLMQNPEQTEPVVQKAQPPVQKAKAEKIEPPQPSNEMRLILEAFTNLRSAMELRLSRVEENIETIKTKSKENSPVSSAKVAAKMDDFTLMGQEQFIRGTEVKQRVSEAPQQRSSKDSLMGANAGVGVGDPKSNRRQSMLLNPESHLLPEDLKSNDNVMWNVIAGNARETPQVRANVRQSVYREAPDRDQDEDDEDNDSEYDVSERKLRAQDSQSREEQLQRQVKGLMRRMKEMETMEAQNRKPTYIQPQRTLPPTDNLRLDKLDVPSVLKFMRKLYEYEERNDVILNPIKYVDFQVKLRLQTTFYDEDISNDISWAKQDRNAFFSRLQQYVRPRSKEQFVQILSNNAYFRQGFADIDLTNWDDFLVAVYSYSDRFRRLWAFMSLNNAENTPRVDNKENGAIKLFLAKFPNQYGSNATRDLVTKKYHKVETFIEDFLELLREQRNRLVAVMTELRKFGNTSNFSSQKDKFQTPAKPYSNYHNNRDSNANKVNAISADISEIEEDPESSFIKDEEDDADPDDPTTPVIQHQAPNETPDEVSEDEEDHELNAMDPKAKDTKPLFACYSKSITGKCDAGAKCKKEHSNIACENYVKTSLEKILRSPYLKPADAQQIFRKYTQASEIPARKVAVAQRTDRPSAERKLTVLDEFLMQLEEISLRPMHVQASINLGDDHEVKLQCLLDSGASHANYVSEKFLQRQIPSYRDRLKELHTEVRTGDNSKVLIQHSINLPVKIDHNGVTYEADLDCCVLTNSNTDLIIGLPTLSGELYDLTVQRLEEARGHFQRSLVAITDDEKLTAVIKSVPYHSYAGDPAEAFSDAVKQDAPEEKGFYDHQPDSFPGLVDVMDGTAEEKFKEFKELQDSKVNHDFKKRKNLIRVLDKHFGVFYQSNFDGLHGIEPIDIITKPDMPTSYKPPYRPIPVKTSEAANKEINRMKTTMYIPSQSPIVHPIVVAAKATHPFVRICGDYRWLNQHILKPHYPIPVPKEDIRILQKGQYFGEADITNSFHQLPITQRAMQLLSVSIPGHGTFSPTKMPEGVSSASEHLQRIMTQIFEDFIRAEWLLVIFDNIVVIATSEDDLIEKTEIFLQRCEEYNLFLKFPKCTWGYQAINFFGYRVSNKGYHLTEDRIQALDTWTFPRNTKKMQSFLGFTLFFSPFVPAYSTKAARLYECVHKDFNWRDESTWKHDYVSIFQKFKDDIKTTFMIVFPDYSLEWQLFTDASDLGTAAVLFQVRDKTLEILAFVSHKFSDVAFRWSTIEKEAFAIFHALKVLRPLLWGKRFTVFTDHANLRQLEKSEVPKLQRWTNYMASFDMLVIHVPGPKNPADAGSRSFGDILPSTMQSLTVWEPPEGGYLEEEEGAETLGFEAIATFDPGGQVINMLAGALSGLKSEMQCLKKKRPKSEEDKSTKAKVEIDTSATTPDTIFEAIHNGKVGHWGVARTYDMANRYFVGHAIPIRFFQDKIASCPICQKYRLGMKALEPLKLHMKVRKRRAAIGADVLKITPESNGYIGLLVIVVMATKLVSLHPIKNETSLSLAREFFQFYSRYGLYDQVSVDPGSNISQSVLEELQKMLGVSQKISLVDRHESNGAEGTNQQILRHLRCLVQETRAKENWSDPEYLACCQYILNAHVNKEASDKYSPFELTFGSEETPYYLKLGEKIEALPEENRDLFLKKLNENLKMVWDASVAYQDSIIHKRASPEDAKHNRFQAGDLVLHLENKRATKLDAEYSGPYSVIQHERNTVEARHVSSGLVKFLHISRLKPFFGTAKEALDLAVHDNNQFTIDEILAYRGNPETRTTLEFQIRFADGDTRWVPWSKDLFESAPYETFCRQHTHLFPLLYTVQRAKEEIKKLSNQVITDHAAGDTLLVNLRSFGEDWYQGLKLRDLHTKTYAVPYTVESLSEDKRSIIIKSKIYKGKVKVDSYYLFAYVVDPQSDFIEVTPQLLREHPELR
jgi:hypothetical protein